jgi:hypothetical protein
MSVQSGEQHLLRDMPCLTGFLLEAVVEVLAVGGDVGLGPAGVRRRSLLWADSVFVVDDDAFCVAASTEKTTLS